MSFYEADKALAEWLREAMTSRRTRLAGGPPDCRLSTGAAFGLAPLLILGGRWRPARRVDAWNWWRLVGAVLLDGVGATAGLAKSLRAALDARKTG
jgi:hypothetical protein